MAATTLDRVVLITGGASGIGAAIALLLAQRGYGVVIADVQVESGEGLVAQITQEVASAQVVFFKLDVTSEQEWAAAVAFTVKRFGKITALVNNAGIGGPQVTIEETTLEDWNLVHNVNCTGAFLGCKAASEELKKTGRGASVVNVSSVFALVGGFGVQPAYHSSKGAILSFTKSVAKAWAPFGVRVNCVHPGIVSTPLTIGAVGEETLKAITPMIPLGRLGDSEELATVIAFLLSEEASFMTGAAVVADGGFSL